jgi:DNA-binding response OmpR family regulator
MRLLIVEDEAALSGLLAHWLSHQGWAVDVAPSLADGRQALALTRYDCVLLDLGLPDGEGFSLLQDLRQRDDLTPVLAISARDALSEKLAVLNQGADDFIVKPFEPDEIGARIRAVLRRRHGAAGRMISVGNLAFDESTRDVHIGGQIVVLPRREVALLQMLLRRVGRVVSREALDQAIYNWDEAVGPNAIEAQISRLRKRLIRTGATVEIQTVRGLGYILAEVRVSSDEVRRLN